MKTRVGVIFGGRSGEHEISCRSARTVVEQIDDEKYDVVPVGIGKDGQWQSPAESLTLFPQDTQDLFNESFGKASTAAVAALREVRQSAAAGY